MNIIDGNGLIFNDEKDIYNQILRYNDIEVKKQNRDKIKIYVQKYINGNRKSIEYNRVHYNRSRGNKNQPKFANAIYKFMVERFPKIHKMIMNYEYEQREIFNKEILKYQKRNIKKLCHDLQIIQRELIEKICKKINEIGEKYITLFDGIYVKEHFNYDINYDKIVKEYFN